MSIHVVECQNKVNYTKVDGWLLHFFQISNGWKFYNNKFEDKFGLRLTCFWYFNKILNALYEELNENNETSNNDDDENSKTLIIVMDDDKGDSNSSFSFSSNIDNEEKD